VPKAGEGAEVYVREESIIYKRWLADLPARRSSAWPKSTARAAFQPISAGNGSCWSLKSLRYTFSAVVGSITESMRDIRLAGNPPCLACSRTISSFGAM
jgi:hypothetical protein